MKHPAFRVLALAVVCTGVLLASQSASAGEPNAPPDYVAGRIVVGLPDGETREGIGIQAAETLSELPGAVTIAVPEGRELEYAADYANEPGVLYAEPDYLRQPLFVPDDPLYPLQWNMRAIGAEQAWDTTRGEGVTIAVVDTGVAFEDSGEYGRSPELSQTQFVFPYNATDDSLHPNDRNGHGTHVTGTLAQDMDDGAGTTGLVPEARIMPVKVCLDFGCPASAMAKGIRWAVDHGADIISMSLGGPSLSSVERDALEYAESKGVVAVAAAGNGGADFVGDPALTYPAAMETVIAVGATDLAGDRARYSNYGEHQDGEGLLIMAPGGDNQADLDQNGQPDGIVQSTYFHACNSGVADYKVFSQCYYNGTSMATPHVSGVVAMMLSVYGWMSPGDVRTILQCSARDIGVPGYDFETGAGLVQANGAIADLNDNGLPDCLEPRPKLTVTVGGGQVTPEGQITLIVRATVEQQPIGSLDVRVTFDRNIVRGVDCQAMAAVFCEANNGDMQFSGVTPEGIDGSFDVGSFTVRGVGEPNRASAIALNARAGAVDPTAPQAEVTTVDGLVILQDVPGTVPGDLDCNGVITAADVTLSVQYAVQVTTPFCVAFGDVNCSGGQDVADTLTLLTFLADLPLSLPAGCPAIGVTSG